MRMDVFTYLEGDRRQRYERNQVLRPSEYTVFLYLFPAHLEIPLEYGTYNVVNLVTGSE